MEHGLRLARNVRWRVRSAGEVRARIASTLLRASASNVRIGSITLHPHQRSAVERLDTAIDQLGGALLCDDVGMGKTYVALAVARRFTNPLIVAPAALIDMWKDGTYVKLYREFFGTDPDPKFQIYTWEL